MVRSTRLFTIFVLILSSCHQSKPKIRDVKAEEILLGEWSICAINTYDEKNRRMQTNFNVCPTIGFKKDHSGYLKSGSSLISRFDWSFSGDSLIVKNSTDKDVKEILNLNGTLAYSADLKEKRYHSVILFNKIRKIKYFLGR